MSNGAAEAFGLEPIKRLRKDIKMAAVTLSKREVRFLTDLYYQMQGNRIRAGNQIRSMDAAGEPHAVIGWFGEQFDGLESQVKKALQAYAESDPVGRWCLSQHGIGPIISAGLLAHIDIANTKSAGQIWSFAGLHADSKWEKGSKRPWNARLKTICYHAGECFIRFHNHPNCFYGKLYEERRSYEDAKNEKKDYQDQAEHILATKRIGKDTDAYGYYSEGTLPPAHMKARARRWAVKMFLSHWFEVSWYYHYGRGNRPPMPYILAHGEGKHVHRVEIPNFDLDHGFHGDIEVEEEKPKRKGGRKKATPDPDRPKRGKRTEGVVD
jgi:hypothetical protein